MRALVKLTWLEIKIFVREPMGMFGTVGIPVLVFVIASRLAGPRVAQAAIQPGGSCRHSCRCWLDTDVAQCDLIARHDHLDLSRGRDPEAFARDTLVTLGDPLAHVS